MATPVRRSNAVGKDWIDYDPALFTDAVEVAGIQIAELPDGRIAAAYIDERGGQRMAVCGSYGLGGILYRRLKGEAK